jgi:hypothetical protein
MHLKLATNPPARKPPIWRRVRYLGLVRARRSRTLTRVYRVVAMEAAA